MVIVVVLSLIMEVHFEYMTSNSSLTITLSSFSLITSELYSLSLSVSHIYQKKRTLSQ